MNALILGLVIFLGVHSVRMFAEGWRSSLHQRLGPTAYKGLYSLLALLGLVLIIWGYAQARQQPVPLWVPPLWTRHLASLLTLVAFVLLAAAYVPRNGLKARVGHPMVLAVKVWALAHLLANGNGADLLLFGGFLLWAGANFRAARARDRAAGTTYPGGTAAMTSLTVVLGLLAWAAFALWGHAALIGVRPF